MKDNDPYPYENKKSPAGSARGSSRPASCGSGPAHSGPPDGSGNTQAIRYTHPGAITLAPGVAEIIYI